MQLYLCLPRLGGYRNIYFLTLGSFINLCYAQFRALLLVEILEQPIRILKNERSIILCWKYLFRIGPSSILPSVHSCMNCSMFSICVYTAISIADTGWSFRWGRGRVGDPHHGFQNPCASYSLPARRNHSLQRLPQGHMVYLPVPFQAF